MGPLFYSTDQMISAMNAPQKMGCFPVSSSCISSPKQNLAVDEIHLWIGPLDRSAYELNRFRQSLSGDERLRADQFHFGVDRDRFIVGRGLLRKILGSYLRIDPGELRFKQGANGKPALQEIDGRPNLHFNLAHSGGLGLFAFSYKHELGVDLECIRHVPEMEQIVERFYPPGDKDLFRAASQDQKRKTFFDCWTRREALVKASGEGLSDHFADFDLVPERPGNSNFSYIQGKNNRSWVVINLELTGEYSASLAINANRISSECIRWIKIAS